MYTAHIALNILAKKTIKMQNSAQIDIKIDNTSVNVNFSGTWSISNAQPDTSEAVNSLEHFHIKNIILTANELENFDSSLIALVVRIAKIAKQNKKDFNTDALPREIRKLLAMALTVPAQEEATRKQNKENFLERIGSTFINLPNIFDDAISFVGEVALSFGRLVRGKSDMRLRDLFAAIQECGAEALPIISITSLLFGLILAFVGAVQLTQFGAQIYVAGLVGIGMLRVMGAVMVGVVMSGRMGAAYAALIGTMQVNEEVDSLTTFGISPIDFLVMPRMIALCIMTPLLTLYADAMGVFGGFLVGTLMLGLSPQEYIVATINMVAFKHVIIGLVYGTSFGIIVALTGCYQGIRCGRSAAAVGMSTTAAVVNAIVGIIIATAIITIICNVLKV